MGNRIVIQKKALVVGLPKSGKKVIIDHFAFGGTYIEYGELPHYSQEARLTTYPPVNITLCKFARLDNEILKSESWDALIVVIKASASKEEILKTKNIMFDWIAKQAPLKKPICIIHNVVLGKKEKYTFKQINNLLSEEALPGKVLKARIDINQSKECPVKLIKILRFIADAAVT